MNVGARTKENEFIRVLASAIFRDCICLNLRFEKNALNTHSKLLLKYIDNESNYELEVLNALQALIHELEHPQGVYIFSNNVK